MKTTGDKISINGKSYILGDRIGGGGEGSVFKLQLGSANAAIKIVNTSKKSESEIAKIRQRIKQLIDIRSKSREKAQSTDMVALSHFMSLPQYLLDDEVGYAMKLVENAEPLTNFLTLPSEAEQEEWQKKYDLARKYRVIAYLFERLEKIHIEGLIFSDLSPNNILVSTKPDSSITFIDTDNLRTRDNPFTNVLGTPGFIAPEILKSDNKSFALTDEERKQLGAVHMLSEESDIYSAAVIAFELLTFCHPYKGIKATGEDTTPEDEMAAERGEFDYILKPGTDNYCVGNIFVDKFDDITTPEIRALFARTFIEGRDNPLRRPSASEFKEEFQRARRLIVKCPKCGEESVYSTTFDDNRQLVSNSECINPDCKSAIGNQLMFVIYADGSDKSIDNVVLDCDPFNLSPSNVYVTKILLAEGLTEMIYLPDLGISGDLTKSNRFMQLSVKKGIATIQLEQNIGNAVTQIISTKGKPSIPVSANTPINFPYENDYLRFNDIKTKYGKATLYGKIVKI